MSVGHKLLVASEIIVSIEQRDGGTKISITRKLYVVAETERTPTLFSTTSLLLRQLQQHVLVEYITEARGRGVVWMGGQRGRGGEG